MGGSVGRTGRRGFRDINVTPLVDVMLVLVIVFMVTAPMMTAGLKLELPQVKAANTPVKDDKLLVSISAEGLVYLGEEDITGRVLEAFEGNERLQSEKELYIRGDKKAAYGRVAEVVAAARLGGVEALNLLVEPESLSVEPKKEKAPKKGEKKLR